MGFVFKVYDWQDKSPVFESKYAGEVLNFTLRRAFDGAKFLLVKENDEKYSEFKADSISILGDKFRRFLWD